MPAEKNFEHKITDFLESHGIYALGTPKQKMIMKPVGYYCKRWGGGKYIKAGLPDYQIVIHGICIEVEVKAPRGRVSELQQQKLDQINHAGCYGLVLYPSGFEKFKKFIYEVVTICPKNIPDLVIPL